jgi:RNase P protein component
MSHGSRMTNMRKFRAIERDGLQRRLRASARQVLAALVLTLAAVTTVVATMSVLPEQRGQQQAQNAPGGAAPGPAR